MRIIYPKVGFSPYENGFAFCPRCGRFYPRDKVPRSKTGAPLCPFHHIYLRTRAR